MLESKKSVVIIDYDVGNVLSIKRAVETFCQNVIISRDVNKIKNADKIILPGVGSFPGVISKINKYDLFELIKDLYFLNKSILGICVGMQISLEKGLELNETKGLHFIKGEVVNFRNKFNLNNIKLPNIGWRKLINFKDDEILKYNFLDKDFFYFIHSFLCNIKDKKNLVSLTKYENHEYAAIIKSNNYYGCQFHPEKSSIPGINFLKGFIDID